MSHVMQIKFFNGTPLELTIDGETVMTNKIELIIEGQMWPVLRVEFPLNVTNDLTIEGATLD